jgi:hypothetical protein
MNDVKEMLKNLISMENINLMSPWDIINEVASNQYNEKNLYLKDRDVFERIPEVIRYILLLADFDTEVNMNGILGFLENSTGLFLNETIDALKKIEAFEDMEILKRIREILTRYGISTQILRDNVNKGNLYDINNFSNTHGDEYDEMADMICAEADKLYIRCHDRNIFDNLERYIEKNKDRFVEVMS